MPDADNTAEALPALPALPALLGDMALVPGQRSE
jgi:hypothetical protein